MRLSRVLITLAVTIVVILAIVDAVQISNTTQAVGALIVTMAWAV